MIGDFLARHYPDSQGARQCAKIAMASYLKLYTENPADDKEFESEQIMSIADYIVKKWPDQPEAAEALNTLIPFMIRAKKLEQAQDYLAKIPADSPQRGMAELKTGQALWASYLENSKQVRDWETARQPEAGRCRSGRAQGGAGSAARRRPSRRWSMASSGCRPAAR